jgi:hypothetical protein
VISLFVFFKEFTRKGFARGLAGVGAEVAALASFVVLVVDVV